jgi:hypothetical protein
LDAVGFVVKSSDARLTPSQSHIFESVIGIFGCDVKENVRFLATFADGKRPPLVLGAIKEAKLACQTDSSGLPCYQKFNNGAIYVSNQDEEDEYSPIDWRNGMKNFKEFFDELSNMPTKSLHLTKELWVFTYYDIIFFLENYISRSRKHHCVIATGLSLSAVLQRIGH